MASVAQIAWSSVAKKVITSVTGFALMAYIIVHLLGNLTLFIGPAVFNEYAFFLEELFHGWFVIVAEIGLVTIFLFHIVAGITVAWTDKRRARPERYAVVRDVGKPSRKTLSSRSMILTGIVLLIFVPVHVWMFKFGSHTMIERAAEPDLKNLYETTVSAFKNPLIVAAYVLAMVLLGLHLRHGFWSSFQSLGWANERTLPFLTTAAVIFAVIMAAGYVILPVYAYFALDPAAGMGGH
ncbi:MAG: succinate dehydrogenase cytochrome b subunit [Candidatus Krumholzibacteriia bacterium]